MSEKNLKIAVIGAGASGVMALIRLRQIGQHDVTIFEKAHEMGGTWRDNRYPGIACDVPSHLYRFSFAPNPDWSRVFSPGSEILEYFRKVYREHGVAKHVIFGSEVIRADFSDGRWTLATRCDPAPGGSPDPRSEVHGPFDAVITAMGILRYPVLPSIEGLDTFGGSKFHTACWDDATILEGARVGIIGTGSTAIQIVPAIVDRVAKVSLFQRTAQWIVPMANDLIPEEEKARYREDPELMAGRYAHLASRFNSQFAAAVVGENPQAYETMTRVCQENLRDNVHDPVLRAKLTPNYKVGCKRLVMSDSFYPALQRPNAELVTDTISRIEPTGVRTCDGRLHVLDVLVLATGYDAHATLRPMQVTGKNGLTIDQAWADSNAAYLGVTIPGFPNFFMIGGPNSPIGNFSFLMTAENQCRYALELIKLLASGSVAEVSPKVSAMHAFNDAVKARMPATVWVTGGCRSWYMDRNGDIASWPFTFERFEQAMREPVMDDFEIVPESAA